jgi:signal transduction histidine kinase
MKQPHPDLAPRYLAALRAHLGTRRPSGTGAARDLGRAALAAGRGTLDLARMHKTALVALAGAHDFANARNGLIQRAGNFFAAAIAPLAQAHRATRASCRQLRQRAATLRRHTAALARANRRLRREVARRIAGEAAVRQGKAHYRVLFMQSQLMQEKLRRLARQMLSAQEDERREISRELHDEVVQTLVGINVELATLGKAASLGLRAVRVKIARTQRLVAKSVSAVHQFARELRPAVLDDLGLIPALHAYVKNLAVRKNLKIHFTAFAGVEALDSARRTVLYRVAQEALTNVARHAQASAVNLRLTELPGAVRLEVHDNGRSFNVPQALSARTNRRLGLLGMRERVEMVGGTLAIASAPGRGTTVRAELPRSGGGGA